MEPLLVFPDPPPPALAHALGLASYTWKAVGSRAESRGTSRRTAGQVALVCADDQPDAAFALCRSLRKRDVPFAPLLLVLSSRNSSEPSNCVRTSSTTSA